MPQGRQSAFCTCSRGATDFHSPAVGVPTVSAESAGARAGDPTRRNVRRGWGRLGAFLLLVLSALTALAVASRKVEQPARTAFDTRAASALKRARPEFVFIGSSMVGTRFDEAELRRLLKPRRVSVLGLSGMMSSGWYLAFKNLVIASGQHPRTFVFFREQELTDPRRWVQGPNGRKKIERFSLPEEPVLDRKLAPRLNEPIAHFEWYRKRVVPLELLREKTEPLLEHTGELGSRLTSPASKDTRARTRAINDLFAMSNLRVMESTAEPETTSVNDVQVFEEVVAQSFLPDIIELAKADGIPLTFVRVRTRAAAMGEPKKAAEQRYDSSLEAYLEARGAEFYDLHDATWEAIEMYGVGDHIAGNQKRQYTRLFVEHMGQIFH